MIRTNIVYLTCIEAIAFRQKLVDGGSGITVLRSDTKQPGIASISTKTGEPIPSKNTNTKLYPLEAFQEAMTLTTGMPYKKQGSVKYTPEMVEIVEEEVVPEEVIINEDEYQMIVDTYLDKNGNLSYDLLNKEMIKFLKSSKVVQDMIAERKSAASIRNYIISNKFKNITGNDDLTGKELKEMVDRLDAMYPKGVFKELNEEIRKALGKNKKK